MYDVSHGHRGLIERCSTLSFEPRSVNGGSCVVAAPFALSLRRRPQRVLEPCLAGHVAVRHIRRPTLLRHHLFHKLLVIQLAVLHVGLLEHGIGLRRSGVRTRRMKKHYHKTQSRQNDRLTSKLWLSVRNRAEAYPRSAMQRKLCGCGAAACTYLLSTELLANAGHHVP